MPVAEIKSLAESPAEFVPTELSPAELASHGLNGANGSANGSHAGHGAARNGHAVLDRATPDHASNGNGRVPNGQPLNGHSTNGHLANGHPGNGQLANSPAEPSPSPKPQEQGKLFRLSRRTASLMGVQVLACGSYAPPNIVTNATLENAYGYEPGWIEKRTGIKSRRYAPPEMATSDMCVEAAKNAMRAANVGPSDIDLVIIGTFTPDYLTPSTACLVQDRLGIDAPAVDLQAACSGFMYSLVTGSQYVATGNSKLALVIGADLMSRIVNTADQRTAPLFGDGAGAVLLAPGTTNQGLVCYQMGSDGSGGTMLGRLRGGSRFPLTAADIAESKHCLHMDGRNVFKWAVRAVIETMQLVLEKSKLTVDDVSLFVLHQANERIIAHAMEQLKIPPEKVFNNVHNYGNTSAGSIPLVLDEAWRAGRFQSGDTIALCGFGAGLSWGTALFRW